MTVRPFRQAGNLRTWLSRVRRPGEREGQVRRLRRSLRQLLWRRRQKTERKGIAGEGR